MLTTLNFVIICNEENANTLQWYIQIIPFLQFCSGRTCFNKWPGNRILIINKFTCLFTIWIFQPSIRVTYLWWLLQTLNWSCHYNRIELGQVTQICTQVPAWLLLTSTWVITKQNMLSYFCMKGQFQNPLRNENTLKI